MKTRVKWSDGVDMDTEFTPCLKFCFLSQGNAHVKKYTWKPMRLPAQVKSYSDSLDLTGAPSIRAPSPRVLEKGASRL